MYIMLIKDDIMIPVYIAQIKNIYNQFSRSTVIKKYIRRSLKDAGTYISTIHGKASLLTTHFVSRLSVLPCPHNFCRNKFITEVDRIGA